MLLQEELQNDIDGAHMQWQLGMSTNAGCNRLMCGHIYIEKCGCASLGILEPGIMEQQRWGQLDIMSINPKVYMESIFKC